VASVLSDLVGADDLYRSHGDLVADRARYGYREALAVNPINQAANVATPESSSCEEEPDALPEIVMFFLGPDGELLDNETQTESRSISDVVKAWKHALEVESQQDGSYRNRDLTRQVQGTGRPGRPGFRDEILVTLRTGPVSAVAEALRADLFHPPIGRLHIDESTREVGRYELSWQAVLRVSPWQKRQVKLRLYASPSLNVSVLSLLPPQQRSSARRGFLRIGLRAMNELKDRIDERAHVRLVADTQER
jgi:hypothetical protein